MQSIRKITAALNILLLIKICCVYAQLLQSQPENSNIASCPVGYYYSNGWCYPITKTPICPEGYQLQNNMCYPKTLKPCPFETKSTSTSSTSTSPLTAALTTSTTPSTTTSTTSTSTTTTSTTTSTTSTSTTTTSTTTTSAPITTSTTTSTPQEIQCTTTTTSFPAEIISCPNGSIFFRGVCRKLICPYGAEFINERCIQVICPFGTVWRAHKCQPPGHITTILEIENVHINEPRETPGYVVRNNVQNIFYQTDRPKTINTTPSSPLIPPDNVKKPGCCTIFTPRICKKYGKKWVCFNNRLMRCDSKICKFPTMYLKIPKVIFNPPILIMPPNPPLQACPTPNCDAKEIVVCSGCAEGDRKRCSPYCYEYICPEGSCGYIDHAEFCLLHPREVGCTKTNDSTWGLCK